MGIIVFIFSFFYSIKKKIKEIEVMVQGINEIAKGNLANSCNSSDTETDIKNATLSYDSTERISYFHICRLVYGNNY